MSCARSRSRSSSRPARPIADSPEPLVDCLSELARSDGACASTSTASTSTPSPLWLDRRTDGAASPGLAELVHDRSGGNPFFAQELVELLVGEDRIDALAAGRVPAAVSDVVRRRVGRLPADSQKLLSVASVVGRTFDLDVVGRGRDRPRSRRCSTLSTPPSPPGSSRTTRPSRPGSGSRTPSSPRRSRPSSRHPPGPPARCDGSRARDPAGRHDRRPRRRARPPRCWPGAIAGSAADAVRWSIRAAERAEERHAPEDAAGHYERALGVVDLGLPR